MKIAYLILAHNTPNHLPRLINSLSTCSSEFFVHIDKKYNKKNFSGIQEANVHSTQERVSVFWGDYSQVEAILILLKTALLSRIRFDRFVLISGSDYPLRSAAAIERYFILHDKTEFINMIQMPADAYGKPISRLTTYKLSPGDGRVINAYKQTLMKLRIMPRNRNYKKFLLDLIPYGGSTWWALTRDSVEYIHRFIKERPKVVNFFRNTVCPDEAFFQTILGNSHFKPMITGNLTYADWSSDGPKPANISEKHLDLFNGVPSLSAHDAFGHRDFLFARKFTDDSLRLVSILDSQIRAMDYRQAERPS